MDVRFRVFIIMVVGALAAAMWTFPQWWPLLNDETVSTAFPGLEADAQPDFVNLPVNVQRAYLELLAAESDPEENVQPGTALAMVRARLLTEDEVAPNADQPFDERGTVIRRGEFIRIDAIRGAEGEVTIYQLTDLSRLLRFEDFRATHAPDTHVILTRNPDPLDERGVGVDYIDLGPLQGNVGAQTYSVPTDINFSVYPILALYSVEYDFVISTATLG
jgi:hypothetical protein